VNVLPDAANQCNVDVLGMVSVQDRNIYTEWASRSGLRRHLRDRKIEMARRACLSNDSAKVSEPIAGTVVDPKIVRDLAWISAGDCCDRDAANRDLAIDVRIAMGVKQTYMLN
jgi:hypothetical protein